MMNPQQETLAAAISCTNCSRSRVVATTAAFVSATPARNGNKGGGVHRDTAYLDCQEPMSAVDPELRSAHRPVSTHAGPSAGQNARPGLNDMDLSPQGLADAPANETDPDSLVYAGNS